MTPRFAYDPMDQENCSKLSDWFLSLTINLQEIELVSILVVLWNKFNFSNLNFTAQIVHWQLKMPRHNPGHWLTGRPYLAIIERSDNGSMVQTDFYCEFYSQM